MAFFTINTLDYTWVLHIIFILSILGLLFEILVGGFLYGFLSILGFIWVFNMALFSWISIVLVILGVILILLEVFYPSKAFFFLTGNGLLLGSFFNLHSQIMHSYVFMIVSLILLLLFIFIFYLSLRKFHSLRYQKEFFSMEGLTGTVLQNIHYAQIDGSIWYIQSDDLLSIGNTVKVIEQKGLTLKVKKEQN